ncbi:hypothetical protein [Paraclostridium sordellii]|uniref:hypothetical protein n=1 Tax=Paraclostridium sordellii TaxID=1505 RepID=UPI0005E79182|nr:hypothetical protein [Paeniclostridium sordellii]CEP43706.1 Uncharacterised protein [[Clostridium] sordellii] [Paeniclostridium sordellii]CEP50456.1 Uncharacterised protein [[Clostridium] sordellii] [Paeniclostridium sordellii]
MEIKNNEKKWVVYKRMINLRNEDLLILKKYGLKKAQYIYTGECEESRIKQRTRDFIYKIKNRTDESKKDIHIELDTAIIYQNIIKFYKEHKKMTQKEAESYLFKREGTFIIEHRDLNTEHEAKLLEQKLYHTYLTESKISNDLVVLKNRNSQLQESETSIKRKRTRRNEEFNSVEMKLLYKNNKYYIKFNDKEYEMTELKITPIMENNDIIVEEYLKKDRKKPSN